jgi:hypothetical protein
MLAAIENKKLLLEEVLAHLFIARISLKTFDTSRSCVLTGVVIFTVRLTVGG